MIDTAGTLCKAGDLCKEKGASQVFAFATHGLFNGPAADRILDSKIEKVFVTDSIPLKEEVKQKVEDKIEQLSLDLMIAELIRRTHLGEKKEELLTTPYY
jgi:ribose-phosphate pyrophosphokinase